MLHAAVANFAPRVLVSASARGADKACAEISESLLLSDRLPTADQRVTYNATSSFKFHVLVDGGVRYLILGENELSSRAAFAALDDMRDQFTAQFGTLGQSASDADAGRMARTFTSVLQAALGSAASTSTSSRISSVKAGLARVKTEAMRGIELAMVNTEQINALENKSEQLSLKASEFNRVSARVSRHMWWASKKMQIAIGVGVVVALVVVYAVYAASSN